MKQQLFVIVMLMMVITMMAAAYAQPTLDLASDPTVSDRIEAAETNTDIDLQRIDDILDVVSTEYIPILHEATLARDDNTFSDYRNQIDSAMWDIHLE